MWGRSAPSCVSWQIFNNLRYFRIPHSFQNLALTHQPLTHQPQFLKMLTISKCNFCAQRSYLDCKTVSSLKMLVTPLSIVIFSDSKEILSRILALGIGRVQMSRAELPEIWSRRCEWERVSDVKTAVELFQRTGFIIQLLARQNLWSLISWPNSKRNHSSCDQSQTWPCLRSRGNASVRNLWQWSQCLWLCEAHSCL